MPATCPQWNDVSFHDIVSAILGGSWRGEGEMRALCPPPKKKKKKKSVMKIFYFFCLGVRILAFWPKIPVQPPPNKQTNLQTRIQTNKIWKRHVVLWKISFLVATTTTLWFASDFPYWLGLGEHSLLSAPFNQCYKIEKNPWLLQFFSFYYFFL